MKAPLASGKYDIVYYHDNDFQELSRETLIEVQKSPCPLYPCAYPTPGCYSIPQNDSNGCPTCGKIVCDKCSAEGQTCSKSDNTHCCSGLHCESAIGIESGIISYQCVKDKVACKSDNDCPQINCLVAPCPKNKCIDGKCTTSYPTNECNKEKCKPYICCDTAKGQCIQGFPSFCSGCTTDICNPTCGNGICELNEDKCVPSSCTTNGGITTCTRDCLGYCPQDCKKTTCTDSDGGINYYVQGTVSIINGDFTDFCYNYDKGQPCAGNEKGCVLVEHSCNDDGTLFKEKYNCPNGCNGGVCGSHIQSKISKQDVVNWINTNCYDSTSPPVAVQQPTAESKKSPTSAVTGKIISKIFANNEYWKD